MVDQKRIARNTLLLYLRMGLVMLVGLYTSRVVLDVLGEVDQGIYDAIGGVVVMFSFLSTTMSTACQRFFSFELGRDDSDGLRTVFSQALVIFVVLVLIVVVVGETAGWWFVEHKMRMAGRDDAARWVFHCSIAGFIFLLMRTPYMGMIIARERMKVFAYISVFEALGALAVAIVLQRYGADKLKLYALLTLALQTLTTAIYWLYCRLFYRECRPTLRWHGRPVTQLFRFTGWEMMGTLAGTCKTGGVSILINMFFGPLFNTPLGRAQKVYMTIAQLQTNFYMAVRPQIIKSYAVGAMAEMEKLFFQSTRLTYYLLLVIAVPLMVETPFVLDLWLKDVPAWAVTFCTLQLVMTLITQMADSASTAVYAQGDIKHYAIWKSIMNAMPVLLTWLAFHFGGSPIWLYIPMIVVWAIGGDIVIVWYAHQKCHLPVGAYLIQVLLPLCGTAILMVLFGCIPSQLMPTGFPRLLITSLATTAALLLSALLFAMTKEEKTQLLSLLKGGVSKVSKV